MRPQSAARAALLAARMSLIPAAPVDLFRFLNVPAIVMVLRRARLCREAHPTHAASPLTTRSGSQSRRSWSAGARAFRRR